MECAARTLLASVADSVEELCEALCECTSLSRVTFSESSSLKFIVKSAFSEAGGRDIHDRVEMISRGCFLLAIVFPVSHFLSLLS